MLNRQRYPHKSTTPYLSGLREPPALNRSKPVARIAHKSQLDSRQPNIGAGPPARRDAMPQLLAAGWAAATDSSYVIAGERLTGFPVVTHTAYFSWLRQGSNTLYLLKRVAPQAGGAGDE